MQGEMRPKSGSTSAPHTLKLKRNRFCCGSVFQSALTSCQEIATNLQATTRVPLTLIFGLAPYSRIFRYRNCFVEVYRISSSQNQPINKFLSEYKLDGGASF
jgi:hypothetical protein